MAKVPDGTLRNWNDGETVTSADYEQALEILRTAINSTGEDVEVLKSASAGVIKGIPYGTSFPSNPSVGDIFYRNDLDVLYIMDESLGWATFGKAGHTENTSDPHQSYAQAVSWVKEYGLGTVSKHFSGDLNTLKTTGMFYSATGGSNRPSVGNGYVFVQSNDLSAYVSQIYIEAQTGLMFQRICNNNAWQQWRTLWDNVNLPEPDLVRARDTVSTVEDINWKYTNGVYRVTDGGSLHSSFPPGVYRYGTLICTKILDAKVQIYLEHNNGRMFFRNAWGLDSGQSWTAWKQSVTQGEWLRSDRVYGDLDNKVVYFGGTDGAPCRIDNTGTSWRMGRDGSNYFRQDSDGSFNMVMGGVTRHIFYANGTKSGGSIEIDGLNLGMSPIDSPQTLIEYIAFNVNLTSEGTKVVLREHFRNSVENFALFPNKGEIVEKGHDYFIIKGTGTSDIRIVGERIGYANQFWQYIQEETE